jgi:signal transduction histidine kinase
MSVSGPSSVRYALVLSFGYVAVTAVYIWLSSLLAAGASHSVSEMLSIETRKGLSFVGVTGALLFLGALWVARRLQRDAALLSRQERALVANEGRVVAGLMAASVAHDANNVLAVVLGELDELRRTLGRDDSGAVRRVETAAQKLVALNRRLLDTAREGTPGDRSLVDLAGAAHEVVATSRAHAVMRGCRVSVLAEGRHLVLAPVVVVQRIIGNLLLNAAEATAGRGRVEVRIRREGDEAVIEVHDDGHGVPAAQREQLFDALQSTKTGGSGLGLFSVRACAQTLDGEVEVGDSELGGALFRVRLPVAPG